MKTLGIVNLSGGAESDGSADPVLHQQIDQGNGCFAICWPGQRFLLFHSRQVFSQHAGKVERHV